MSRPLRHLLLLATITPGPLAAQEAPEKPVNYNPLFGSVVPRGVPYQPLTGRERLHLYAEGSFGNWGILLRTFLPATIDHATGAVPEWGGGVAGYTRRSANRFGRFSMQDAMEASGAALLGHEVRYPFSDSRRPWRRVGHALGASFITLDRNGHRIPAYVRIGTTFAAEYASNLWMPPGEGGAGRMVRGVAVQFGFGAGFNLVREFSPEWKRFLRRKRSASPGHP